MNLTTQGPTTVDTAQQSKQAPLSPHTGQRKFNHKLHEVLSSGTETIIEFDPGEVNLELISLASKAYIGCCLTDAAAKKLTDDWQAASQSHPLVKYLSFRLEREKRARTDIVYVGSLRIAHLVREAKSGVEAMEKLLTLLKTFGKTVVVRVMLAPSTGEPSKRVADIWRDADLGERQPLFPELTFFSREELEAIGKKAGLTLKHCLPEDEGMESTPYYLIFTDAPTVPPKK